LALRDGLLQAARGRGMECLALKFKNGIVGKFAANPDDWDPERQDSRSETR